MRTIQVSLAAALMIPSLAFSADVPASALRASAQKGLALLEKTSPTFLKKGGCNSCHNQMLPAVAQAFARRRGIATGETIAQLAPELSEATTERIVEYATVNANSLGYELFGYAAENRPADARIEAEVYSLKSLQESDGYWRASNNRPPIMFDDFTATAFAIYGLKTYTPAPQRADSDARIARARSWLLEAKPRSTQERAFQLLGLVWSNAGRDSVEKAVRAIETAQRKDGGWSQLPETPSDAYATGISLYALYEGGAGVTRSSYQSGLRYLLDTQATDGTWHVKARALPVQPYFESGYPYGHDQWISAAGAAYAVMAISLAVEPQRAASR